MAIEGDFGQDSLVLGGVMFIHLKPSHVWRVVSAKRKDEKVIEAWNKKHGFLPGEPYMVDELFAANRQDPIAADSCIKVLMGMTTASLEELQILMYLGRDLFTGDGNWKKEKKTDLWRLASSFFGEINRGDHAWLVEKIKEKALLEIYLKEALKQLPIHDDWIPVRGMLRSRRMREDGDSYQL